MREIAAHTTDALLIITNYAVAHVTYRTLPERHRHALKRLARRIIRRGTPQTSPKTIHQIHV